MRNKKFETRLRYDSTASNYDNRYFEIQLRKFQEVFSHLDVEKEDVILDVGGGTGLLSDFLKGLRNSLICCDISFEMLKKAKIHQRMQHLVCTDSDSLPFKSASMDIITCFSVIQNLPQPKKTVEEMQKSLRKDGTFALTALQKLFTMKDLENLMKNDFDITKKLKLSKEDFAIIGRKKKGTLSKYLV